MQVVSYPGAPEFLRDVGADLERCEAENSLILGLALALCDSADFTNAPPYLATVQHGDTWLLAALMTPPLPLVLAASGDKAGAAIPTLVQHLLRRDQPVSGVTANHGLAEAFAVEWEAASQQQRGDEMRQRIYRLHHVITPRQPSGHLRRAVGDDQELVGRWFAAFQVEAIREADLKGAVQRARRRIEGGEIYLWEDLEARSMVGRSRPTRTTITVNAVYTPPHFRRQGYATAAVAGLSQALLAEGYAECVLYTDLANPTSNAIYQRIGYEPVCDSVRLLFGQRLDA